MNDIPAIVAQKMIQYFGRDVKRIHHALKVYAFAENIAALENMPPGEIVLLEIAALLHDIGIKEAERQYNSSAGPYQELLGPAIARDLLQELNLPRAVVDRICYLIGHHHTYPKIDGLDFQILVEADFLVNIVEDQMSPDQIQTAQAKYFKTKTGTAMLTEMFM